MRKSMIVQNTPMFSVVLCLVVFYSFAGIPGNTINAATINAASCEQADVQVAITAASPEDTVLVPAGNCTWTSTLTITKGINLIGAGIGNTVITNGLSDHGYLISYDPSDYDSNHPIRISGFTFDLNNNGPGIHFGTYNKQAPFTINTKGRIDHNRFYNSPNPAYQAIWNRGTIRGVVDNNIFDSVRYPIRSDTGTGTSSWWDHFSVIQYGAADDNLYFEDNIFNGSSVNLEAISDAQFSGRYIFRYNTIISETIGSYSLFDMHGNAGPTMHSSFGGEIYGNSVTKGVYGATLLDHRGGKALVFNNYLQAGDGAHIKVREEYDDATSPTTGGTQHVNDSYYWGNRVLRSSLLRVNAFILTSELWHNGLAEDIDFFQEKDSFDGTSGIGCGTFASRPLTCTKGVGYWATSQSCSDLTGMVGANPVSPISGTLYKCTATNTWTAYYTPFTYPHPLRTNDAAYEIIVNVYPNPCRVFQGENSVTFFGDLSIGDNIKIYDMSGKTIHDSGELLEATYEWNVSDITSGIFFFVVKSSADQKKTSGKIAVIR